jgi:hypothetical protein
LFIIFLVFFINLGPDYFILFFIPCLVCIGWVLNCFMVWYFTLLFFHSYLLTMQYLIKNWFFLKFIIWYLAIKSLASLFFVFFFFVELSWFHILDNRLIKLTTTTSNFFPSFFYEIDFFFNSGIKLLADELSDFFHFFSIGLSRVCVNQANPGWLAFSYSIFLFNFGLFYLVFLLEV